MEGEVSSPRQVCRSTSSLCYGNVVVEIQLQPRLRFLLNDEGSRCFGPAALLPQSSVCVCYVKARSYCASSSRLFSQKPLNLLSLLCEVAFSGFCALLLYWHACLLLKASLFSPLPSTDARWTAVNALDLCALCLFSSGFWNKCTQRCKLSVRCRHGCWRSPVCLFTCMMFNWIKRKSKGTYLEASAN